jgi:protein SDA1
VYFHILADIQKLNKKTKNTAINRSLQNFMYSMLSDTFRIAAKKSLDIMIQLYRKGVWNDDKTVNVISTACFVQDTKMVVAALKFFLGVENDEDEEQQSIKQKENAKDKSTMIRDLRFKHSNLHSKKTRKKDKMYKKAVKIATKTIKGQEKHQNIESIHAMHLLNDPQGFCEKLFNKLKSSNERYEVRVMMMDVISRCISSNGLTLLNFYPYVQKYLQPSQPQVTRVLAIVAQSVHDCVPPDALHPVVMTIANNFANDRSKSEVITVGLNTIREICSRQPLVMRKSLLRDLAQYAKSKNKNVFHAARGIITLFRHIDPKMLKKKDRGRNYDEVAELPQFGASKAAEGLEGIELLEQARKEMMDNGDDDDSDEGEWIDISDDEDEGAEDGDQQMIESGDEDDNEEITEYNEDEAEDNDDLVDLDDDDDDEDDDEDDGPAVTLEDLGFEIDHGNTIADSEMTAEEKEERRKLLLQRKEERKKKIAEMSSVKILTQEDFELLKRIKQQQAVNKVLKRKRDEFISEDVIEEGNKRGLDDDSEDEAARQQEEKQKWKKQRTHGGGKTKKENAKAKPFMMLKHSRKVSTKIVLSQRQRKIRKDKSMKKQLKHKLKHR